MAFDNGLDDHETAFNGTAVYIMYTNLASFHPIISEITMAKRAFFGRNSAAF